MTRIRLALHLVGFLVLMGGLFMAGNGVPW